MTKYVNGLGIDDKIRQTVNGQAQYFVQDHLGSTNALTDATGNVVSSATYDSFGNATANLATRYGYTGREKDADTGLYFYRNRWYDSNLGRFISEDPIGLAGGINQFGYVGGNPQNFVDPSGLIPTAGDIHDYIAKNIDITQEYLKADYDTWGWYGKFVIDFAVGVYADTIKLFIEPLQLGRGIGCAIYGEGLTWWERGLNVFADIGRAAAIAGAVGAVASKAKHLLSKFSKGRAPWSRNPKSIQDQMALEASQKGAGTKIIDNLGDSRFKGMEKWEYKVKSTDGRDSVVHYVVKVHK